MTNSKKEKQTILFSGAPELRIIGLVRRSHSASECKHRGNCLREEDMIAQLHYLLAVFAKTAKKLAARHQRILNK